MLYIFKTDATMKEYNSDKYWIDRKIIRDKTINAENVNSALAEYREIVNNEWAVEISANALKTKKPIYKDTQKGPQQCGYCITGKTLISDRSANINCYQYIDLWVEILTITKTIF